MSNQAPSVSIIIVNYNGRNFLSDCLTSLEALKYPKSKYEVLLVDNSSSDSSVSFVKRKFPWVKIIPLETNTGFTGGNNIGIEKATGEYIVLLNNDTIVDKNWLLELVKAAKPRQVGIVSSKIYLRVPYIKLKLKSTTVQQSELDSSTDFSPRGVLLEDIYIETERNDPNPIWFANGFSNKEVINGISLRWSVGEAEILLPVSKDVNKYAFTFHGYPVDHPLDLQLQMKIGNETIFNTVLAAHAVKNYVVTLDKKEIAKHLVHLVQNAGNAVLANGYSKDRGSVLRLTTMQAEEFYEPDSPFYSVPTKLAAACGAAMLIKRQALKELGALDGYYFMYYEDIDLSLRAWRMGWDIAYAPQAMLHHIHRASSGKGETSFFINMAEKNHLLLVFTHFPLWTCLQEYTSFMIRLGISILKQFVFRFTKWEIYGIWRIRASGRLEAFWTFHSLLPYLVKKRFWWGPRFKRSFSQLEELLY